MRVSVRFAFVIALAAPLTAGCGSPFSAPCGPESRGLTVLGREGPLPVTDETVLAQVSLSQGRHGVSTQASWSVQGRKLKPHVTSVELRDGRDGALIRALPLYVDPPPPMGPTPLIAQGNGSWPDEQWSRLAAGRAVLELQTTLPERPLVRLPLPVHSETGVRSAECD
jgi:hypothetical protein